MNISIKAVSYAGAAFLLYSAVSSAVDIGRLWDGKIRNQRENFYQVSTSRDKWRELSAFRAQWPEFFSEEAQASVSRHELYKVLNLSRGLKPTVSRISKSDTSPVQQSGQVIGLSQTCVQNEPNGFAIGADNLSELFAGLRRLEDRREITFTGVSLSNKSGKPQVIIRDLCVYFRTGAV